MRLSTLLSAFALIFALTHFAHAHYGMIIPNHSMPDDNTRSINVVFSFSHPFEGIGMNLDLPKQAAVIKNGKKESLKLNKAMVMGHPAFSADFKLKRPGIYNLIMEPTPYFEPEEDVFIIHYTKTTIAAWNDDEGWDQPVGLKTEIIPFSKPFGLYAGNVFQGRVFLDEKPVPYAEVEVEFYNKDKTYKAPSQLMITQTIKADANGIFTYAAPWAGWWGFAALNTADYTMKYKGKDKEVELGAVLWVEFKAPVKK